MLATLKAMTAVWAWLAAGGIVGVGALALAYFVPPLRQFASGVGICAIAATVYAGNMVRLEHDVCEAKFEQAKLAAEQRDKDQAEAAKKDEAARVSELEAQAKLDSERIIEYEKRLADRKTPACTLSPDDLR